MTQFKISDILQVIAGKVDGKQLLVEAGVFFLERTVIGGELLGELAEGDFTGEDARDIGIAFSDRIGNVKVLVDGRDVVRTKAQQEIFGGLARIGLQILKARDVI
tara:strand:- start:1371 stop:1685 length:315 start_codon:yes stop_codon:yes gene_type:complete